MMPVPEAAENATQIHPGIWGILGAFVWKGGEFAVALVKRQGKDKEPSISEKLDLVLAEVSKVKIEMATLATRDDINIVQKRITYHIEAHAEGRFNTHSA